MVAAATVDLNADLAEGFGPWQMGDDAALLAVVTSANLACGFHAGDPLILAKTLALCAQHGVAVGAHPSWPDLWGFGRRPQTGYQAHEVAALLHYQVGAVQTMAAVAGLPLQHMKLHGALANQSAADPALAAACAKAIAQLAELQPVRWLVMPHTAQHAAAIQHNVPVLLECYVDRGYDDAGLLLPRDQPGAVLHDIDFAVARAVESVRRQALPLANGRWLPTRIDSLCVHGDSPGAVLLAQQVRLALQAASVQVRTPTF
jgi:UPF0271 protein